MGAPEDAFEAEAKLVLRRLLGGTVVDRDVGGAQGLRDFDLVVDGDVTHAVEVTSVQLPTARAARTGLERLRTKELGLTASWHLYVHEEASTRPIEASAPSLLNLLFASGLTEFDELDPPADPALAAAVEGLASLRIPRGFITGEVPPRLSAGAFGSGSLDPSNLTRAIEAEAAKEDNRRKLASAPTGAVRHLFVWLHDSNWYVSSLLRSPIANPPRPLLPAEVDVVWAAVGDGPGHMTCSALLRGDSASFVELDPHSGAPLPSRNRPGAAVGPPEPPPPCRVCGRPGAWEQRTVQRTAPDTGDGVPTLVWHAKCASDPTHWGASGRALSAAELRERQST